MAQAQTGLRSVMPLLAFDPLSSQGIYNALDSGMRSGASPVHAQWCGEPKAADAYEEWIAARGARYLEQRTRLLCT